MMTMPKHACGLYLQHNVHKDVYETAVEWMEENDAHYEWEDAEAKDRAINSDEIWTLQWYPNTPIGFHAIAAPTLEELLAFAKRVEGSNG